MLEVEIEKRGYVQMTIPMKLSTKNSWKNKNP